MTQFLPFAVLTSDNRPQADDVIRRLNEKFERINKSNTPERAKQIVLAYFDDMAADIAQYLRGEYYVIDVDGREGRVFVLTGQRHGRATLEKVIRDARGA